MTYGVTPNGFVRKDYTDILEDLKEAAKSYFGDDIDLSDTSPLYKILQITASEISQLWAELERAYYSGFFSTASGAALDQLASLFNVIRSPATYASGTVRFSRTTPAPFEITISEGTRVSTDPDSSNYQVYQTVSAATIPVGGMFVDVVARAVNPGSAGNVAANSINTFVDYVAGVNSVTNITPMSGGSDEESDEDFRWRLRNALYAGGAATLNAITSALLNITGVTKVNVVEDTVNHTITAYVLGGSDSLISSTLESYRPAGITAIWSRPTYKTIDITADIDIETGYAFATVSGSIYSALQSYFNRLNIGEDIEFADIIDVIMVDGVDDVNSLSITDGSTTITNVGETLAMDDSELAILGTVVIT